MNNACLYFSLLGLLFIIEIIYFKIADRFNIIDKPNHRSSHTKITLRGGGIIFSIGIVIYFFLSGGRLPYFSIGVLLIALISFWDDIKTLSSKFRLSVHIIAVTLLFYQAAQIGIIYAWYYYILLYIIVTGIINAINFMDGINGITVSYGVVLICSLYFVNNYIYSFTDSQLLIIIFLSLLVFGYFNFRKKAKCFAGDIGSITLAFITCYLLLTLISFSHNYLYVLFLAVYGIDTVFTILIRLKRKENIFEAHRLHLYQLLSNELKVPHLIVSSIYAFIQLVINILVVYSVGNYQTKQQVYLCIMVLVGLGLIYLITRFAIRSKKVNREFIV